MSSLDQDWQDDETRKMDLELENQSLELDQHLQDAVHWKSDDLDPKIHNAFLHHVNAFEDLSKQPQRPIQSFFPEGFSFPPVESMTREQLAEKLDAICEVLANFGIDVQLRPNLPDEYVYKYLVDEVIPHETTLPDNGFGISHVIDGCTGSCEDCFQAKFCDVRDEIYGDDEKLN
jgi:hypothetical protein